MAWVRSPWPYAIRSNHITFTQMQNHQRKLISKILSFLMIAMFRHLWYVFECLSTPFDLIFQIGDIIWNFCCSQSFWFSSADIFPLGQILCHRWSYLNFFNHFIGFYESSPGLYCYLWFGRSYYAYENTNEIFQLHIWKSLQNVFEWRNLLLIILYSIKADYYLIFDYNSTAVTREPYSMVTVCLFYLFSMFDFSFWFSFNVSGLLRVSILI